MTKQESSCKGLYRELMELEDVGVCINIDGYRASPIQIVTAHLTRDHGGYMRDYQWNDEGKIKEVSFWGIKYGERIK